MTLFDPHKVPFSTRGSFHCISWLADDSGFWLRNLRGGDEHTDLGRLLRIEVAGAVWHLTPDALTAQTEDGAVTFRFAGPNRITVTSDGPALRLHAGASKYNYAQTGDPLHVCIARQDIRCDIATATGSATLDAPWNGLSADSITIALTPNQGILTATLDLYRITPHPVTPPDNLTAFRAALPQVPPEFAAGHDLASYILWSNYVPAEGALTRPSVYMSKNWMTNIWSWDHCFVALALGQGTADLAFDQMQAVFDTQDASGRLPDYINDRYAYWSFTKPPVHGWTFARLRQMRPDYYGPDRMAQVLGWLQAQADFWLNGPALGDLPAYRHGNDAGWDNATCFAMGGPVASPDLTTFLILQLDEIAALHRALGHPDRAATATQHADALCAALIRDLWTGTTFTARLTQTGAAVQTGQSLLLFLPLLLGDRLPTPIRESLLAHLLTPGRYLTQHGLATEATDSPLYRANGYWRGPIWAPTTALFADALRRCGRADAACDLARRYCTLCTTHGMAENHDALHGDGLHDPAFAWTSAVFLMLGNSLL